MLDQLSVPRRPYDFEDYVDILRRNLPWIVAPILAALVLSTVIAYLIPDTFISKAKLRIVPQQIPEAYVAPMTGEQLADHITAMAESILSRETLTNIINSHGIYKHELKSGPMEDVINQMRTKDIKIGPATSAADTGSSNSKSVPMQISFAYRDPYIAQDVCRDLVSRFMNQNTQDTMESQVATHTFLDDEYQRARQELEDYDRKLSEFRSRNAGRLPEQMEMNISQMNAVEGRVTSLNEAIVRNTDQRMLLESSLNIAKERLAAVKDTVPVNEARDERVKELDQQIRAQGVQIADMKDRYKDDFPDLVSARQQLAVLQGERAAALKQSGAKEEVVESPVTAKQRMDASGQIDQIQTQLKANALDAQQLNRELVQANGELGTYQSRASGVPAGEKEYTELVRDRDLARQKYDQLEGARQKSSISMDMEKRKQGETLEQIDSASLPTSPTAPKRYLIIPGGGVIGLIISAILVGAREVRNTSLKNLKDARLYTQLSVLGSIPLLENDLVVQRRKQIRWVGWTTATLTGIVIVAASIAHYYLSKA